MLQHKISFNGHHVLRNKCCYHVSFLIRRLVSYDQYESPTIPHNQPNPRLTLTDRIPTSCNILIAGGGIIGQSVAYHLSQYGIKDIVLIEKAK